MGTLYKQSEKYIGGRVYNNEKSISVISNVTDMAKRFEMDNRIAIAGVGVVNFGFDQKFKINGGIIGEFDALPMQIRNDEGQDTGNYRFITYNGSWMIKSLDED